MQHPRGPEQGPSSNRSFKDVLQAPFSGAQTLDFRKIAGRALLIPVVLGAQFLDQDHTVQAASIPTPVNNSTSELPGLPSSQQSLEEQLKAVRARLQSIRPVENQTSPKIEASVSFTDTVKPLEVTREWLRENPQFIHAKTDILDPNGQLAKQYAIAGNEYDAEGNIPARILYETHQDPVTKQFTEFKAIAKVPMETPQAIASSANGEVVLIGGGKTVEGGETALYVSFNGGRTLEQVPWTLGKLAGPVLSLSRISDDTFIGVTGGFESWATMFIVKINSTNPDAKSVQILSTNLVSIQGTSINVGAIFDLGISSVDANGKINMTSTGSAQYETGISLYTLDTLTGQGTVKNIDRVINEDTGEMWTTGYLTGKTEYNLPGKPRRIVSSNVTSQVLVDMDPVAKTGNFFYYGSFLESVGKYFLSIRAMDVIVDDQGNKHTWLGGSYAGRDGAGRAIIVNKETKTYYDLAPDDMSTVNSLKRVKIGGQLGYEAVVRRFGKVFIPINPDGSPMQDAKIHYLDKGLGNPLQRFYAFLGNIFKQSDRSSVVGSW